MAAADEFKQGQRKMWAVGSFPTMARTIKDGSDVAIDRLGVEPGQDLLDVATGTGNAAIPAAQRGARVVALDQVPELLEAGLVRATEAGVEIEWVAGDAENLPFDADSFDRVCSVFGVMFAPRHRQAAEGLVRVTRPGGRIVVVAWTPEGLNGQMFTTIGAHLPPPPAELTPPILWGDENHVAGLFAGQDVELSFERHTLPVAWESIDGWIDHCEANLGPVILAKGALDPQGGWDDARADLVALYERHNQATDGSLDAPAEFLVSVIDVR